MRMLLTIPRTLMLLMMMIIPMIMEMLIMLMLLMMLMLLIMLIIPITIRMLWMLIKIVHSLYSSYQIRIMNIKIRNHISKRLVFLFDRLINL